MPSNFINYMIPYKMLFTAESFLIGCSPFYGTINNGDELGDTFNVSDATECREVCWQSRAPYSALQGRQNTEVFEVFEQLPI